MPSRILDFPIFDADNHMYETPDALTKYLAEPYKDVIKYVDIEGRTKIAVKGTISEYIPNPTFNVVAAPGAQEEYFKSGNPEGKSRREIIGKPIALARAFSRPRPRVKLMDELGIDRALMLPTLASLVEERLRDDPYATHAVIHALNEWMYEQWSFNYEDRIFATPVINLPIVDKAIEELEWVHRARREGRPHPAGARHHGLRGPRSFGAARVRPVLGARASTPTSSSACTRPTAATSATSTSGRASRRRDAAVQGRLRVRGAEHASAIAPIEDTIAAVVGHGLPTRFPDLKILPVENGSHWVRPSIEHFDQAYEQQPQLFDEDPVEVLKRNIWVHPFHEEDPMGLIDLVGVDHVLFGSDYPHPEGMSDPITLRRRPRRACPKRTRPRSWAATSPAS